MFYIRPREQSTKIDSLVDNAGNNAGANGTAAFADGETQAFIHGDRRNQLHLHGDVIARHHHLGAFRQVNHAGHVGGAEVELRTIVGKERRVTATLFLRQDVRFCLELGVRL